MSSLAYINERAANAVNACALLSDEEEAQIARAETPVVSVAGFPVVDTGWHDREREKRVIANEFRLSGYRRDAMSVTAVLESRGITPLAVLPSSAWKRLCDKGGLYRMFVNDRSEVCIDAFWASSSVRGAFERGGFHAGLASFIATVCAISAITWHMSGHNRDATTAAGFVALLVSIIVGAVVSDAYVNRSMRKLVANASHKELLDLCFPIATNGTHPGLQKNSFGRTCARIMLPEAPPEVTEILARARGLDLYTAAEPDAIRFAESPIALLERLRKEREEWLKADPIIYLEHGSAVAIIAQFGDFPIEQRVVDEVLGASYLP